MDVDGSGPVFGLVVIPETLFHVHMKIILTWFVFLCRWDEIRFKYI